MAEETEVLFLDGEALEHFDRDEVAKLGADEHQHVRNGVVVEQVDRAEPDDYICSNVEICVSSLRNVAEGALDINGTLRLVQQRYKDWQQHRDEEETAVAVVEHLDLGFLGDDHGVEDAHEEEERKIVGDGDDDVVVQDDVFLVLRFERVERVLAVLAWHDEGCRNEGWLDCFLHEFLSIILAYLS